MVHGTCFIDDSKKYQKKTLHGLTYYSSVIFKNLHVCRTEVYEIDDKLRRFGNCEKTSKTKIFYDSTLMMTSYDGIACHRHHYHILFTQEALFLFHYVLRFYFFQLKSDQGQFEVAPEPDVMIKNEIFYGGGGVAISGCRFSEQ